MSINLTPDEFFKFCSDSYNFNDAIWEEKESYSKDEQQPCVYCRISGELFLYTEWDDCFKKECKIKSLDLPDCLFLEEGDKDGKDPDSLEDRMNMMCRTHAVVTFRSIEELEDIKYRATLDRGVEESHAKKTRS